MEAYWMHHEYIYINIYEYEYIYECIYNRLIGLVGSVFSNCPGDRGSILGRIIPKTFKNGTWYVLA